MPTVPATSFNATGYGFSPLAQPSQGNLLMAAALQRKSRPPASAQPDPTAPKALNRRQKALK